MEYLGNVNQDLISVQSLLNRLEFYSSTVEMITIFFLVVELVTHKFGYGGISHTHFL